MINRRSIITCLIGLNCILAAVGLLSALKPSSALGQVGGRSGEYICVTGRTTGQTYEVLYMLDVPGRKLHAFIPANSQTRQIAVVDSRDLTKDFGQ